MDIRTYRTAGPIRSLFIPLLVFAVSPVEGRVIEGVVRDRVTRNPVEEARVRVQASTAFVTTDSEGRFSLDVEDVEDAEDTDRAVKVTVTAWKEGYLNGGVESKGGVEEGGGEGGWVDILLEPIFSRDNDNYLWLSPDPPTVFEWADILFRKGLSLFGGDKRLESRYLSKCSNCHGETTVREWRQSPHSQSAVNPLLLTMYNGTSMGGREGVFPGYRLDFPMSAGNCAFCHAPAAAMKDMWGTDLNEVAGTGREGVFCDLCHKVHEVELHPDGGYPGILSMKFHRPPEGEQIFFGPLEDVIAGPDTYNKVYRESRFCAPCHSARFWGVPIYSDYDEWLESPYSMEGKEQRTCQDCHMAPDKKTTLIAPERKGGVRRGPETLATHMDPGSRGREFLAKAIKMELSNRVEGGILEVVVQVTNVGAGHHFPTGVPMRNMILLVDALDANGERLEFVDGSVVPEWGGAGAVEKGNFAGLPGKGFAKILGDVSKNFPLVDPDFRIPAPHWRQVSILSDNRIPAKKSDLSSYRFRHGEGPVRVAARLFYRRSFKPWIDAKGWPLEDLEIARAEQVAP